MCNHASSSSASEFSSNISPCLLVAIYLVEKENLYLLFGEIILFAFAFFLFLSFLFLTIEISLCQRRIGRIFGGRDESFLSLERKRICQIRIRKSRVIFQRREKDHAYQLFRSPVSCLRISRETARFPPFDRSFLFPSLSSSSSSSSSRGERWMTHDHPRAQGENALYFRTTRSKRPGRKSGKGRCVYVF